MYCWCSQRAYFTTGISSISLAWRSGFLAEGEGRLDLHFCEMYLRRETNKDGKGKKYNIFKMSGMSILNWNPETR